MTYLGILRNKKISTLWLGQVFSAIGDALFEIAITWFAVKALGNRAGLIVAAGSGSGLLFSLFGGVYADRWNRRKTMIVVDILRALIVLSLPITARFGALQPWHLAIVTASLWVLGAVFNPSLTASLPILVPESKSLREANALMDSTWRIARAIGPSLTGFLITQMPLYDFFSIDALSFAISALAIYRLGNKPGWQPMHKESQEKPLTELVHTLIAVSQLPFFYWALVLSFFSSMSWSAVFYIGIALLCKELANGNIGTFGLAMGAYGCASILSNLFWGGVNPKRPAIIMFTSDIIFALGFFFFAQVHSTLAAIIAIAIAATGGPMKDLVMRYLIQRKFPNHQIGKVYSLRWTISNLGTAIGLLLSGPLFQALGTRAGISCLAFVILGCGLTGLIRFFKEELNEPIVDQQNA